MPCASPFGYNEAAGPGTFDVRATDGAGNSTTLNRTFTIACAAPDPNGALGLLHLDDSGQQLANATGGAGATLGLFDTPEIANPSSAPARFATGLAFESGEGDIVAWALGGGASTSNLTIELWARPDALPGSRDVLANGDESVVLRVRRMGPDRIRFIADDRVHQRVVGHRAAETWHHVLVSLSPRSLRLWVDGDRTEENDVTQAGSPSLDSAPPRRRVQWRIQRHARRGLHRADVDSRRRNRARPVLPGQRHQPMSIRPRRDPDITGRVGSCAR